MGISDYFDRHRFQTLAFGFLLLGLIAYLDRLTGSEASFSIFYLIPVLFVAWHSGPAFSVLISLAGAALWFAIDNTDGGRGYHHFLIPYWNALVRLGFFITTSVFLARLRAALKRERAIAGLKSEMISIVSHEFNNSLVTISLAGTLLEEEEGEVIAENRRRLYGIITQTQRELARTVKTFLTNARLDSGKFSLERKPIKVRDTIIDALAVLKPMGDQKEVEIVTDFPDIPVLLNAYPDAISLVIGNLIGNAIKYTPAGGRVLIRVQDSAPPGKITVSVEDTGIGIVKKDLEAVFSGFYRTAQGKGSAKGFGLGLKVSSELIKSHGSILQVDSVPGRGSKFFFTLPAWQEKT